MISPVLNITMPVFNRCKLTQRSLLALRKCSQSIPFTITVVDNGSDKDLVDKLLEFKAIGIIDKLFLLEKNMGISCAANIGWEMTDAPFYMKMDNDILITDKDFFRKIFTLWSHGDAYSTLGGGSSELLERHPGALRTPDGALGICGNTLAGYAIIIPKLVSDILGYWSEDYGLYGSEDGDYGLRVHSLGFKQYYYPRDSYIVLMEDEDAATYTARGLNKQEQYQSAMIDANGGFGLFLINQALYNLCIRTLKPVRKYTVADVSSEYKVTLEENKEFFVYKELLDRCAQIINRAVKESKHSDPDYVFTPELIQELKNIMASGGFQIQEFIKPEASDI
jgi:glycosyltransferase involved in cell wall biosynthesis